jgi:hypothetical protein
VLFVGTDNFKMNILHPLRHRQDRQAQAAYSLAEVAVAMLIMALLFVSLYAGFSSGFAVVQLTREDLRATQIMVKRMENIRLYRWGQITNGSAFIATNFITYYDPDGQAANSGGTRYSGTFTAATPSASSGLPVEYRSNMLLMTVSVYWTNSIGKTNKIVRSRQMQTYAARYGMQNYVYGP